MNDTITPVRSLDQDWQHTTTEAHITLADRLSVRIGLWLLLRAERRGESARHFDAHALRLANERGRQAREIAAQRAWYISPRA